MNASTIVVESPRDLGELLSRVAVVVCELELGETSVAYQAAADLELDLQAAGTRPKRTAPVVALPEAA